MLTRGARVVLLLGLGALISRLPTAVAWVILGHRAPFNPGT